jgi:hypothetical protein
MADLPDGIIIERTPMRDLARRLIDLLYQDGIPAWMASRSGLEIAGDGTFILANAWDVRVAEGEADRARGVLAEARRHRGICVRRAPTAATTASCRRPRGFQSLA